MVTTPSGGQLLLDKGFYNITGLAWSGRGKIKRVDVSVDGGRNWRTARAARRRCSASASRASRSTGSGTASPRIIQSRAIDETGYVQPTYRQLRAVRGTRSIYHNNAIQSWLVEPKRRGEECPAFLRPLRGAGAGGACAPARSAQGQRRAIPGIGRDATPREVKAWDIDVRPDFKGLPPGSGSVDKGQDGVGSQVRHLPRRLRRIATRCSAAGGRHHGGRHQDRPCRDAQAQGLSGPHDADEGADRLDAVGLHQPRDAVDRAQVAHDRRGLRGDRLPAQPRRHHPRRFHPVGQEHPRSAATHAQPQRHDARPRAVARHRVRRQAAARRASPRPA